jgi:hypothetical protein
MSSCTLNRLPEPVYGHPSGTRLPQPSYNLWNILRMHWIPVLNAAVLSLALPFESVGTAVATAQSRSTGQSSARVATMLAEGWAALAAGDVAKAARSAESAMTESPRSAAGVALAVEVHIARGDSSAGLDVYERWLAGRKVDAPYVLRRVAHGYLRSAAGQRQHPRRLEAAKALAADGDTTAAADLMRGAAAGGHTEAALLATLGDPRGVEILIGELRAGNGSKLATIDALVQSRSKLAVAPLKELLGDAREDHRAAAADALGRLGATEAIPNLKALLKEPQFPVRMAAAAALYRLEDYSGFDLLQQLLSSEHPAVRLSVAEVMAVRPGPEWLAIVRRVAEEGDETVRLRAARLLAPYDLETAASILRQLSASENPAVREEAGRLFIGNVATDFAALRAQLRSRDALTALRAADRLLELTR